MSHPAFARIDLLHAAGKITAEARQAAAYLLRSLCDVLGDPLDGPDGIRLVTHLALACQRAVDRTPAPPPSAEVIAELAPYVRERETAARLLQEAGDMIQAPFPESEVIYLAMHLALNQSEEGQQ